MTNRIEGLAEIDKNTSELDSRSLVTLPKKWIRALVVLSVGRKANWSWRLEAG